MTSSYDYIISGAGCAGLSLLYRMLQEPVLQHKKILVIDNAPKTKNDRTWCFWEKENSIFQSIIHHQWDQLNFRSNTYNAVLNIEPYNYKMLQGLDFYNYVMQAAQAFPNVKFIYETVTEIKSHQANAVVITNANVYSAQYVFNSIIFSKQKITKGLLQHFKGWLIKTEEPVFNASVATFMDFTVSQQHGTTFMYVLPTGNNVALVEYTLFTEELLKEDDYNNALKNYIHQQLQITQFELLHEEFGVIPMTAHSFVRTDGNIVNIGTAGGDTKGSSGYTFQFIQKRTAQIVTSVVKNQHPFKKASFVKRKFKLYDDVLLDVLQNKKMKGAELFTCIFQKNNPQTVLQFLDNETGLLQDLKIMSSVPMKIFLPVAIKKIFQAIFNN
ncbi:MAG: lycopene cyclase [Chitinophaga sp.]|nr:lycopene cyclase [Chitinophaga sp.]